MATDEKLMLRVNTLLKERGQNALKLAKEIVLQEKTSYAPLAVASQYFMMEIWNDYMHPALMSLACEAVGENPDETVRVGAAFILLAGGADIHDDIIDQSTLKGCKPTVFGKFGKDIAILVGDALLFKGLYMLDEAVRKLQDERRNLILESVRQAFLGISSAEAKEAGFRGNKDLPWQKYFEVIKLKVAVAKSTMTIGAILGNGTMQEVNVLGEFGETLGVLNTVRDEFIDVFEADELKNRAQNECLPLPILLTFQSQEKKEKILRYLNEQLTAETMEKILDITMDSEETKNFTKYMTELVENELKQIEPLKKCKAELTLLLKASIEDLR